MDFPWLKPISTDDVESGNGTTVSAPVNEPVSEPMPVVTRAAARRTTPSTPATGGSANGPCPEDQPAAAVPSPASPATPQPAPRAARVESTSPESPDSADPPASPAVSVSSGGMSDEPENDDIEYDGRFERIYVRSLGKYYPAPGWFDEASATDKSSANLELWGSAPWFDRDAVDIEGLCELYTNENDVLPNGIPITALETFCWRRQCCARDDEMKVPKGRSLESFRGEFALAVNNGLLRCQGYHPINPKVDVDFFFFRTAGERAYVRRVTLLTQETMDGWITSEVVVSQEALMLNRPQFRVDFRFEQKRSVYWKEYTRDERRARSVTGLAIPYQCLGQHQMTVECKNAAWPGLTTTWGRLEVPRGCNSELSPVFTYYPEPLRDPRSPFWIIGYTDHAAKSACWLLQDVYDRFRLWCFSSDLREAIRELDLTAVLGSKHNQDEVHRLLTVMDNTDYRQYPVAWRNRGDRHVHADRSPGRTGPGADYILYDPWSRKKITKAEADHLMKNRRRRPAGYPTGFNHDVDVSGFYDENGHLIQEAGNANITDASAGWGGPPSPGVATTGEGAGDEDDGVVLGNDEFARALQQMSGSGTVSQPTVSRPDNNQGLGQTIGNWLPYQGGQTATVPDYFSYMYPGVANPYNMNTVPQHQLLQQQLNAQAAAGSSSGHAEQQQLEAARSFLRDIGVQDSEMAGMSLAELKAFARGALGRRN